ncbi:MAG: hypothetical protein GF411_05855 [Candidatus Lokiarchaeota archaeon]|nr:hypothetical protein [Candidatus Lokiarchaeota archaeon]
MKLGRTPTRLGAMLFVVLFMISANPTLVAATFGGSDTPSYDVASGSGGYYEIVRANSANGVCEILVEEWGWPGSYPDDYVGYAYVGVEFVPTEDITNNWKLMASWDLEYELKANWWSCIRIDIVHCVRDENFNRLWPSFSEYDVELASSGIFWESTSGAHSGSTSAGWGIDLEQGETYYFCIELQITVVNGGAVYATSYSDSDDPVSLTVDSISWSYL